MEEPLRQRIDRAGTTHLARRTAARVVLRVAGALLLTPLAACGRGAAERPRAEFDSVHVTLDVARTETQRRTGLGGRQPLGENEGMLFVFERPTRSSFWMKGLTFPLDILWIEAGRVVHLERNVPAPSPGTPDAHLPILTPAHEATYVLEVLAGFADRHGITVGSPVTLRGV